ncbi:MAG TPA: hypothetical protein VE441_01860, partial [Mycobacterium sp.]|nr:hypothetical protein [Mycobacterium sp.]
MRDPIRLSWMRSRLAAAPMDRLDIPYLAADGAAERLLRAAEPILSRFGEQLTDTPVSIVLADSQARVVGRWAGDRSALHRLARLSIDEGFVLAEELAGTNGIGTVLEQLSPVTIYGAEHYSEPLQGLVCVGAPIRNHVTRRIEGVLDLACPVSEANGLLVPTLLDLSAQIEQELSARTSARERIVFEEFLARSRETSAALIGLSERYMVTNAAAAELLDARDQPLLWEQAASAGSAPATLTLASGLAIDARCTNVEIGSLLAGVLVEFREITPGTSKRIRSSVVGALPARTAGDGTAAELIGLVGRAGGRICVVGEAGTGKLTHARRIHTAATPNEPITVLPVGLAALDGPVRWLQALRTRLADPRGSVIVANIEILDDSLAQSFCDLLDLHRDARPLLIATRSVDRGVQRAGLHARFGDAVVHLQPLRQRRDELPQVIHSLLRAEGRSAQIGHRAMAALASYGWPGNFPQLEQVLRAAAGEARGATIGVEHL